MASVAADLRGLVGRLLMASGLLAGMVFASVSFADDRPTANKPAAEISAEGELPIVRQADIQAALRAERLRVQAINREALKPATNALARQWRPALIVELSFVRLVCPDLPAPQRVLVKAAGERALIAAAEVATLGVRLDNPFSKESTAPQAMIRDALSDKLREILPAAQWQHFAAESEARVKRRQSAVIRLVVEQLDEVLYLTQEQRQQISTSLADRWQDSWESWLQLPCALNLPVMPADIVTPYLDQGQRIAWEGIPKVQFAPEDAVRVNTRNIAPDDTDWWDEAVPEEEEKDAGALAPVPTLEHIANRGRARPIAASRRDIERVTPC